MASSGPRSSNLTSLPREAVGRALGALVSASFPDFLLRQRWFGSKGRRLNSLVLLDDGPFAGSPLDAWWVLVEACYADGTTERYAVPLATRPEEDGQGHVIGRFEVGGTSMIAYDAFDSPEFCLSLLVAFEQARMLETRRATVRFTRTAAFPVLPPAGSRSVRRVTAEQSNTSVIYDDALILKAFRKIEAGINPDAEISGFLTARTRFRNIPLLAGTMEYSGTEPATTLAMLQQFVANQGDGWTFALDHLRRLLEFAEGRAELGGALRVLQLVREFSAGFFLDVRRLGALTAGLHAALASDPGDPAFAPEPITEDDVKRWMAEVARDVRVTLGVIRERTGALPERVRGEAEAILAEEEPLIERLRGLELLARERCVKTRIHGDYHLGQTLRTASDFVIFDFEGEPARILAERRTKHAPLKDVAGMLRSFDYAVGAALRERGAAETGHRLSRWGEAWGQLAAEAFLEGYLAEAVRAPVKLLPTSREMITRVVDVFEMDKVLYELRYEINNRPMWLPIPLAGLGRLFASRSGR